MRISCFGEGALYFSSILPVRTSVLYRFSCYWREENDHVLLMSEAWRKGAVVFSQVVASGFLMKRGMANGEGHGVLLSMIGSQEKRKLAEEAEGLVQGARGSL